MRLLYVDSSAWVKRYCSEPGTHAVNELFGSTDRRICSVLGLVEVVATLARKYAARQISQQYFAAAVTEAHRDWRSFIKIDLTPDSAVAVADVAVTSALRGADAVHLAAALSVARRLQKSRHRVVMIASDRELLDAAAEAGLDILDPTSR